MHGPRPGISHAAAFSRMPWATVRSYVDQLVDNLDDSSLQAVFKLMLSEIDAAILKQRGLIALQRLDGRDTSRRTEQLRELEMVQDQLVTLYARYADTADDLEPLDATAVYPRPLAQAPVRHLSILLATGSAGRSFGGRAAGLTKQEKDGVYVGRTALEGEPDRAERTPVRD